MTKEETKERIKVMQAYLDGKLIQYYDEYDKKWYLTERPEWNTLTKYRIKPESTYRPFESAQECIEEMRKHEPFGWVKDKPEFGYTCSAITRVSTSLIRRDETWYGPKEMFQYSTFLDGSPFGVKVEDKEE